MGILDEIERKLQAESGGVREILSQELRVDLYEQPESFDTEWLMRHIDLDQVRFDLQEEMEQHVAAHPILRRNALRGSLSEVRKKQLVSKLAAERIENLIRDPQALYLCLEGRVDQYLNIESATADAIDSGQWKSVPGIADRLTSILDRLRGLCDDPV